MCSGSWHSEDGQIFILKEVDKNAGIAQKLTEQSAFGKLCKCPFLTFHAICLFGP